MEWTKIPTTLITKRFTDYELASIVKFQLVWAINEEQPDKQTCLRYMTSKQYETAMTYLGSVSATVGDEVSSVIRKRNAEKIRYNKNKDLPKNLQAECQQYVSSMSEQIRLDKIREDNIPPVSKDTAPQRVTRFQKPTLEEVKAYCQERNNFVDAEKWYDYYTANGWKVGKNSMRDWKACVRTWERKQEKPAQATNEGGEKMVLIDTTSFYLDDTMDEYKDLFEGVLNKDELALNVWKWIVKNFEGRSLKLSFIRSMIEKFKNEGGENGNQG